MNALTDWLKVATLTALLVLSCVPEACGQAAASLEVIARTDQGAPLPGATVSVRSASGSVLKGETGTYGEARFTGLIPGSYQVGIAASGFQELTVAVTLTN